MCLAVPGLVLSVAGDGLERTGVARFGQVEREVNLTFTPEALEAIAAEASQRKLGARGLRVIMEERMLEAMYSLPSKTGVTECVITRETVVNKESPIIIYEKAG